VADRRHVVRTDIPVGGVLAYTRGQTVDDAALDAHPEWKDLVVGEGSKEARQIHAEITGVPADEPEQTSRPAAKSTEQKANQSA
jgi:hypothetical protein